MNAHETNPSPNNLPLTANGEFSGDGSGRKYLLPGLALPMLLFLIQAYILWKFSIDDVAISYRYAQHLAQGAGLNWNPGQPPVEGYSNFLWVLLLAAGHKLGFDIEIFAKVAGVAFGLAALAVLYSLSRRLWAGQRWWWMPPLVVAVCPVWALWAVSGLELAMVSFFLVLTIFSLTCPWRRKMWLLSISLCGLCLSRPEGVIIAGVVPIFGFFADREFPRARRLVVYGLPFLALATCVVGLLVFRMTYFGYPVANTVYAKFSTALPAAGEVALWVFFGLPFLAAFVLAFMRREDHRFVLQASLLLVFVQMLLVLPVSPVMYVLHRYQIAFLPLLVLAIPLLLARLAGRRRAVAVVTAIVILLWAMQQWPAVKATYKAERFYYQRHQCVVEKLAELPGKPTIALLDAGRIPYWSDLPAVDVWGLCDSRIAREGFSVQAIWDSPLGVPEVYIMSIDTVTGGVHPRLGFDGLISRDEFFQQTYRFWRVCPNEYYYGYAILLNRAWARREGIDFRRP